MEIILKKEIKRELIAFKEKIVNKIKKTFNTKNSILKALSITGILVFSMIVMNLQASVILSESDFAVFASMGDVIKNFLPIYNFMSVMAILVSLGRIYLDWKRVTENSQYLKDRIKKIDEKIANYEIDLLNKKKYESLKVNLDGFWENDSEIFDPTKITISNELLNEFKEMVNEKELAKILEKNHAKIHLSDVLELHHKDKDHYLELAKKIKSFDLQFHVKSKI